MTRINEVITFKVPPGLKLTVSDLKYPDMGQYADTFCSKTYTYDGYVDDCDLFLLVQSINPFSTKTYLIEKSTNEQESEEPILKTGIQNVTFAVHDLSTSKIRVLYGRCTDFLCEQHNFTMEYNYYDSYEKDGQKSGLYIFRDNNNGAGSTPYNKVGNFQGMVGSFMTIMKVPGDKVDILITVNNAAETMTATVVSKIKGIDSDHGKEITVNFGRENFDTDRFYTDSNGMAMEERKLNYRKNYDLTNLTGFEVVANFYPVNSQATLRSKDADFLSREQLTVLNDRAQSVSSLQSGELEFLIHRRTYYDDDRGVSEPLNETTSNGKPIIVQTVHHVISTNVKELHHGNYYEVKRLQRALFEEPLQLMFAEYKAKSDERFEKLLSSEGIQKYQYIGGLPPSIKIVTKPLDNNRIMIRVYNMNEVFDGIVKMIPIDISGILSDLLELRSHNFDNISFKVSEYNLALNNYAGNNWRINWIVTDGKAHYGGRKPPSANGIDSLYNLGNQEMKTFIVDFSAPKTSTS